MKLDSSCCRTPFRVTEFWPSQYFQSILDLKTYLPRRPKREWSLFNTSKIQISQTYRISTRSWRGIQQWCSMGHTKQTSWRKSVRREEDISRKDSFQCQLLHPPIYVSTRDWRYFNHTLYTSGLGLFVLVCLNIHESIIESLEIPEKKMLPEL